MKTKIKICISIATACVVVIGLSIFLYPKKSEEDEILWREYQVEQGDLMASFDEDGTLTLDGEEYAFDNPQYEVSLKVKEIFVEEGDMVEKGDALASFDKAEIEKAIHTVQEELKQAQRDLEDAKENYKNAE